MTLFHGNSGREHSACASARGAVLAMTVRFCALSDSIPRSIRDIRLSPLSRRPFARRPDESAFRAVRQTTRPILHSGQMGLTIRQ